ncbi:hypothetical protein HaLaN_12423 [Haematococcus lacustris]|uniref:Uncharacterized protein n=1 Tax=Haematococcus lacustris TaxID=44745 RepID=A0A699ZB32_HAELA|nr:hypothetical protein HaLaN_12423 [Haematococcus lacustris]
MMGSLFTVKRALTSSDTDSPADTLWPRMKPKRGNKYDNIKKEGEPKNRKPSLDGSAGGSQDEAPAACIGPTVSSAHEHRPSVSYAQALAPARSPAGSAQKNVSPQPQLTIGGSKLLNDSAVPAMAGRNPTTSGNGTTPAADGDSCDTAGGPPSALIPPQRTRPAAREGSSTTGGSPAAAEQLVESLDCDCEGVPGGQKCNGKCGDTYPGSGFVRWISGKRHCVDLGGKSLPQMVSKLHRMVRQLQADHSQQQERMRAQLQAAEQNATSIARAKHDADSKLKQAETSLEQLKQQNQASQKKLLDQHQQLRCQARTELEELRRQSATAQAHARRLAAELEALQKASLHHVEEMETLEERLSTSNAQEEAVAADLRLCKVRRCKCVREQLQSRQGRASFALCPGPFFIVLPTHKVQL